MIDDGVDSRNKTNGNFTDDKFKTANKIEIDHGLLKNTAIRPDLQPWRSKN